MPISGAVISMDTTQVTNIEESIDINLCASLSGTIEADLTGVINTVSNTATGIIKILLMFIASV